MPQDNDEVGYKRPPKQTRFRKGQSGNPRGRPRGTVNLRTDLAEELSELVQVREAGREYSVSKQRAVLKAMVAKAVSGDMRAASSLLSLSERVFGFSDDRSFEGISGAEERMLDDFIEREIARRERSCPHLSPSTMNSEGEK